MQSKRSFCDRTLFLKTLTRFWPLWFCYALAWTIAMPIHAGGLLAWALQSSSGAEAMAQALQSQIPDTAISAGVAVTSVFGCLAAMAVFSHLYFPRSAGAYAALPLRRESVFASVTLGAMAPMLLINLLIFIATLLVELAYGAVYITGLLQWLFAVSMMGIFFFGFAAFCALLTGSLPVLPLVYALLNFTETIVETIVSALLDTFVFGYSRVGSSFLAYLSPVIGISKNCGAEAVYARAAATSGAYYYISGYEFRGLLALGIYAAVGVLLLLWALRLYKRRQMESAGDVVAVKALRPVFKYCLSLGVGLCLGALLYDLVFPRHMGTALCALALTFFMFIGCFIGYFAAEMLNRKAFRVFHGRVWRGFAIVCALMAALVFSCEFDLWGYERRLPDPDRVESVLLSTNGESVTFKDRGNVGSAIALHRDLTEHKAFHELEEGAWGANLYINYFLDDGSIMSRYYRLYDDGQGDVATLEALLNTDEAVACRKSMPFPVTAENIEYASVGFGLPQDSSYDTFELSGEEMYELYTKCILPDIADGGLGRIWLITDEDYLRSVYNCSINFECAIRDADGNYTYQSFYTVPTIRSLRTNQWLLAHGVELHLEGEFPYYSGTAYDFPSASAVYTVREN